MATKSRSEFKDGSSAKANFVVGGDGARSTVRQWMLGYDDALYSGCSAFRGIVAPELLDKLPDPAAIQFWIGPGGHLLHYPIGNGDQNFFLVERHPSPWPAREWTIPANEGDQLTRFKDWHPAITQMVKALPISPRWGLFHRPPLSRWSKGRVTLIGDAAHALVPHHGQGANQSIEDVVVLARCLAETNAADFARAQDRYERCVVAARARFSTRRSRQPTSFTCRMDRLRRRATHAFPPTKASIIIWAGSTSSIPRRRCPTIARAGHGCETNGVIRKRKG